MRPVVSAPKVEAPATFNVPPIVVLPELSVVAKRFVDEAVVAKKLVEVAFVVVELRVIVKSAFMVEEAFETNPLLKNHERLSVAVVEAV